MEWSSGRLDNIKTPHSFVLSIVEFSRFLLTLASRKLGGEEISHRAGEV